MDLSLYQDPKFCNEIRLYALEKTKFLLIDILRSRLPGEYNGNHELFLSEGINTVDHNGLNLLDYCTLAGLNDFGGLFAKLGCTPTIDTVRFAKTINQPYDQNNIPLMISAINKAIKHINIDLKEYSDKAINKHSRKYKKSKKTLWKKIKHVIKNFPYRNHKFAILLLSFGLACIIAAPFTGGLSTILLFTLGFPSILAGLNSLQSAIESLNSNQQSEDSSRIAHEIEILKIIHKDICDQVKIQLFKLDAEPDVSVSVLHSNLIESRSSSLLFSNSHRKKEVVSSKNKSQKKHALNIIS